MSFSNMYAYGTQGVPSFDFRMQIGDSEIAVLIHKRKFVDTSPKTHLQTRRSNQSQTAIEMSPASVHKLREIKCFKILLEHCGNNFTLLLYLTDQFCPILTSRHWDEVGFLRIEFFLFSQIQEMANHVIRIFEKCDDSPEHRLPVANVGVRQIETSQISKERKV